MNDSVLFRQLGGLVSQQIAPHDVPASAWPDLITLAMRHGMAPMLLWAVKQSAPELVTEPLWTPVIRARWQSAAHMIRLDAACKQVTAALEAAQIPALWLKGIALAHTVYPQPSLRTMSDLDVLVPYEQREQALAVVQGLGYHFFPQRANLFGSSNLAEHLQFHHYQLRGGLYDSITLELHFHLLMPYRVLPYNKLAWFWSQTRQIHNGSRVRILQPEAHLLYLIAHALIQHGEAELTQRQILDVHLLIMTYPRLDWNRVVDQAAELGWGYAVDRALRRSIDWFATPIPAQALEQLAPYIASDDPIARHVRRLAGKGPHLEYVLNLLTRLSLQDRIRLMGRLAFPPRAYMRAHYGLRDTQPVWPAYLTRWRRQARGITWGVWYRLVQRVKRR